MKRKTIGECEFVILDDDEVHCEHKRTEPIYSNVLVNPNGEYVEGYGRVPVCVQTITGQRCASCGLVIDA